MNAATRRASASRAVRRLTNLSKNEIDLRRVVAHDTGVELIEVVTPVSLTPEIAQRCSDEALEYLLDEEPTDLVYVEPHPLRHVDERRMTLKQAVREYDLRHAAVWGSAA